MRSQYLTCHIAGLVTTPDVVPLWRQPVSEKAHGVLYSKSAITHTSPPGRNRDETQREGCPDASTRKSMHLVGVVLPVKFLDLAAGK